MPERYNAWVRSIAKTGLISKGLVYIIFGTFILMATYTAKQPLGLLEIVEYIINLDLVGRMLVFIMAIGLLSYAIWKWLQMVHNVEDYPKNTRGYLIRITWLGPFIFYIILAVHAVSQLYKWYFGQWDFLDREHGIIGDFFLTVPGKYFIGAFALVFLINAVTLFYLAFSGKYTQMLTGRGFSLSKPRLAKITGLVGYLGYGLALLIAGCLFVYSIYFTGTNYTEGQISVFYYLIGKDSGKILLTLISSGTICYGIYFLLTAFYRWRTDGKGSSNTLDVFSWLN